MASRLKQRLLKVILMGIFLSLGIFVFAPSANAKKVKLHWKEIPGATHYEILIEKDEKKITQTKTKDSNWSGDLGYGVYTYQIRGVDGAKRAGLWSDLRPLVVMAEGPEIISPKGQKLGLYSNDAHILMKWKAVPDIEEYKIIISKEGTKLVDTAVSGGMYDFKPSGSGKYEWKIQTIMKIKGNRTIASTRREWTSGNSDSESFEIEYKELVKPKIYYPVGPVPPVSNKLITLKWSEVEGAEKYRVKLTRLRTPAASESVKTFDVTENKAEVAVETAKKYSFDVQAIANIDSKQVAGSVGPVSTSEFSVDPSHRFPDKTGYLAFSGLFSAYNYKVTSPGANLNGSTDSTASTIRVSGEYFFQPQWGIGAAFQDTQFGMDGATYDRKDFEITARYRVKLDESKTGWFFYPKVGVESRENVELVPAQTTGQGQVLSTKEVSFRTIGPQLGFDLRKQMTEKISLGLKINYFYPMAILSGGEVSSLQGSQTFENYSFGLQGAYWINKKWSIAIGGFYDKRSIAFTRLISTQLSNDKVSNDATYFFTSLIYTFGN